MKSTHTPITDIIKSAIKAFPEAVPQTKEQIDHVNKVIKEIVDNGETANEVGQNSVAYKLQKLKDRQNPLIATVAVAVDLSNFDNLPKSLKNDIQFAKHVLNINGLGLQYFADNVKNDFEACYIAMTSTNGEAIKHVSENQKENQLLVDKSLELSGSNYQFLSSKMKLSRDNAIKAVENNSLAYQYLLEEFQKDKDIAKLAVATSSEAYQCLIEPFLDDEEIFKLTLPESYKKTYKIFTLSIASQSIQENPKYLLEWFKSTPLRVTTFIRRKLTNEANIIQSFLSELDKEDPIHSIYRILQLLDFSKNELADNPSQHLIQTNDKAQDESRCIEWLVHRLNNIDLDPQYFNRNILKEKITEEIQKRKTLALKKETKDEPKGKSRKTFLKMK